MASTTRGATTEISVAAARTGSPWKQAQSGAIPLRHEFGALGQAGPGRCRTGWSFPASPWVVSWRDGGKIDEWRPFQDLVTEESSSAQSATEGHKALEGSGDAERSQILSQRKSPRRSQPFQGIRRQRARVHCMAQVGKDLIYCQVEVFTHSGVLPTQSPQRGYAPHTRGPNPSNRGCSPTQRSGRSTS